MQMTEADQLAFPLQVKQTSVSKIQGGEPVLWNSISEADNLAVHLRPHPGTLNSSMSELKKTMPTRDGIHPHFFVWRIIKISASRIPDLGILPYAPALSQLVAVVVWFYLIRVIFFETNSICQFFVVVEKTGWTTSVGPVASSLDKIECPLTIITSWLDLFATSFFMV